MKALVAYFSAGGVTAGVAARLAEAVGGDLYEIVPAVKYTAADLDWRNKDSRSSVEMNDASSRPEIAGADARVGEYDTVYLGFPIWWYVAPTIINTFLEQYDFSGKKIIPFATSGSSGLGRTVEALTPSAPGADWRPGSMLNGGPTVEALRAKFGG